MEERDLLKKIEGLSENIQDLKKDINEVRLALEGSSTGATFLVTKSGSEVYRSENDSIVTNTKNTFTYPMEVETDDDASFQVTISTVNSDSLKLITPITIDVNNSLGYSATSGATLYINPRTRSNSQSNYLSVINEVNKSAISAVWTAMNWSNDGWYEDSEGNKALKIFARSSVAIDYQPFLTEAARIGKTIEIDFKVENASDASKDIISIAETNSSGARVGLKVSGENVSFFSASKQDSTTQDLPIDNNTRVRLTVVVMPDAYGNSGFNLACLYINGKKNQVYNYESNDYFKNNGKILLGNDYANLYIYGIRVYNFALTENAVRKNYVNQLSTTSEKQTETAINKVFDAEGTNIDFDAVKNLFNCFVIDQKFPNLNNPGTDGLKGLFVENGMLKGTNSSGQTVYCIYPDGTAEFGNGSAKFKNDKSGYLAGGAISWKWDATKNKFVTTLGNVLLSWDNLDEETKANLKGAPGADGITYYTWVMYSNSSTGSGMSSNPSGMSYIGLAYNKETPTASNNPSDYNWSKIKGDTGTDANLLDWVSDWNNNKTLIGGEYIISPKMFSGTRDADGKLTGVAFGRNCIKINGTWRTGIFSVVKDKIIFALDPITQEYKFMGTVEVTDADGNVTTKIDGSTGELTSKKATLESAVVQGKIVTSLNGKRVEINPSTNSLKLYNENEQEVCSLAFVSYSWNGVLDSYPELLLKQYHGTELFSQVQLASGSINVSKQSDGKLYEVAINPKGGITFFKAGTPTKTYNSE